LIKPSFRESHCTPPAANESVWLNSIKKVRSRIDFFMIGLLRNYLPVDIIFYHSRPEIDIIKLNTNKLSS
jgi:hypothetical protein